MNHPTQLNCLEQISANVLYYIPLKLEPSDSIKISFSLRNLRNPLRGDLQSQILGIHLTSALKLKTTGTFILKMQHDILHIKDHKHSKSA